MDGIGTPSVKKALRGVAKAFSNILSYQRKKNSVFLNRKYFYIHTKNICDYLN